LVSSSRDKVNSYYNACYGAQEPIGGRQIAKMLLGTRIDIKGISVERNGQAIA
jgi:hypothetical protein